MSNANHIQLLPEHIIDQIKAGEVIERPSTLLKEIIENSVDAKSSKIEIHIKENGIELISLIDDGHGINPKDLPLAFCRHATSKISKFEDIYKLGSYGFRGEALASIASISKLSCETHHNGELGLIKIDGGQTLSTHTDKSELKNGTKLYIKDLFYNTPVRMKFIQSKNSEKNQLKKIINSFLLVNPQITFSIKWDDEDKNLFPAIKSGSFLKRIQDVFPLKHSKDFFENETLYDGVHFKVFLSHESNRGNAHKNHYLFVNKRYVQDIQIHKIILNSAAHLWPEGETGHYVAYLELPADEIDVNIHPNKTVVKIFRAPKVFSVVSSTVKQITPNKIESEFIPNKETQETFNIETQKDIEYKPFNFKATQNIDQYFDSIHNQKNIPQIEMEEENTGQKILFEFSKLLILSINSKVYLLKKFDLYKKHFSRLLESKNFQEQLVPLLVSKPIKFKSKQAINNINLFSKYGFELDQIDSKTLLLRSFPKYFQNYPYIKIIEQNIDKNLSKDFIHSLNLTALAEIELSPSYLFEILNEVTFSKLIELQVLKEINQNELLSLYEK